MKMTMQVVAHPDVRVAGETTRKSIDVPLQVMSPPSLGYLCDYALPTSIEVWKANGEHEVIRWGVIAKVDFHPLDDSTTVIIDEYETVSNAEPLDELRKRALSWSGKSTTYLPEAEHWRRLPPQTWVRWKT